VAYVRNIEAREPELLSALRIQVLGETVFNRAWRLLAMCWSALVLWSGAAFMLCLVYGMKFDIAPTEIGSTSAANLQTSDSDALTVRAAAFSIFSPLGIPVL
jgi:hypothetical protein